jgi:hypothetical protein
MIIGVISGGTGMTMENLDVLMGIILKGVSTLSFFIVIIINWSKGMEAVRKLLRKPENGSEGGTNDDSEQS